MQIFIMSDSMYLSRLMGKPTICIGENKSADQLRVTAKLISAFVFASLIVQFLFYLNPKFQASSSFLCLYRSFCVGPVRKPHCWFSHEAAHLCFENRMLLSLCKIYIHVRKIFCQLNLCFNEDAILSAYMKTSMDYWYPFFCF